MSSNNVTGLFFGVGFAGFVYYHMMRRTGGNAKISVGAAAFAGLVGFFVISSLLGLIFADQE